MMARINTAGLKGLNELKVLFHTLPV